MKEEHKTTYKIIGEEIRDLRHNKGWTQKDLANRCRTVNREKISKIENAREDYMLSTLIEICQALGKDVRDLFGKN
ncbi:helix-turn-helix domain-containing protein [Sphingobacterium corticis]|uniref:Helix-turn-helix domain-containing protein n=1 Tax=Sphingobacterium corticis TaxID=1812823 RepID=A0ABW5NK95_9SPHI